MSVCQLSVCSRLITIPKPFIRFGTDRLDLGERRQATRGGSKF